MAPGRRLHDKAWAVARNAAKWLIVAVAPWYLWSVGAFAADRLRPAPGAAWRMARAIGCLVLSLPASYFFAASIGTFPVSLGGAVTGGSGANASK